MMITILSILRGLNKVFMLVCFTAHLKDIWRKTNCEGQFFQIPGAGNLVLDASPFDGASYRLSSADPTSGLSVPQCCLRALSSLSPNVNLS